MTRSGYSAEEATERLGISRATLYAYVSRGLVGSLADAADPRRRLYRAEDVDRLALRKARGRRAEQVAATTLDWGLPVLESGITLIRDGRLFYRGRDAIALAEDASLEEVARLLWDCGPADPFAEGAAATGSLAAIPPLPSAIDRCLAALAALDAAEPLPWQREAARRWPSAARLLRHVAAAAVSSPPSSQKLHEQLARVWRLDGRAAEILRRALVLCADHELNASAFAVRVVASTRASLAACLAGGVAALSGPLHGGATARIEALFDEVEQTGDAERTLAERLAGGEAVLGFGHPLYPDGDPRGRALLEALPSEERSAALLGAAERLGCPPPTIDFALVAARRALRLPRGAALTLFVIGRAAGWIAHALEQQGEGALIRPRARYIGTPPAAP